ncbi:MAG TPA: M23 family metallopeptidase [Thermoanaerobaculia bacterium]|nr:M23 family metallopeptidase [Thermoanaerobaculia bacterium]
MPAFRLFVFSILLPLITIVMLWRRPRRPPFGWIATFFLALAITGFSVLTAPWGWFGFPVRYALVALFVAAIVMSLRRPIPIEIKEESPLRAVVKVLLVFFFGGVALGVLRAHQVPPGAIDLAFPLRGGTFLIGHGGSTAPANMHNTHPQQRYALDIMKLNSYFMRASGLYPRDLRRYAVFDAEVLSPCDGAIVSVVDAHPDQTPGIGDAKNPAGNHVIVRCGDANVTLAHLRRGSVAVRAGVKVTKSQLLGRVGNSGNTSEPHLHIHAERNGVAVPATFNGEWFVRNELARR